MTGSSHRFDSMSIAPSAGHRRTASFGDSSAVGTPTKSDTASLDGGLPQLLYIYLVRNTSDNLLTYFCNLCSL